MLPRLVLQPRTINAIKAPSHRIARAFHCSPNVSAAASAAAADNAASKNHYERLNVRHDASPGEIKKSFYSLSKTHHPDVNPSDPRAAQTFSLLSESYTVLSDPTARAKYDRDMLRLRQRQQQHHDHHGASYHSAHPAGGRAPSGLSRRRGSFRGPPPSFYKNGAWGAQAERRQRAQAEAEAAQHAHAHARTHHGGMGPGSDPFNFTARDSVPPHFDRDAHTRTHRREDDRREDRERTRRRRALGDDDVEFEPQTSLAGHFFIVAGILGATFLAPLVYLQGRRLGRRERDGL
ncbi:hypothetical protein E4U53_001937 [Claviceps sorghi]|nr:hypothetical protein E4U53_001937 [Claviceps sorghi]